MRFKAKNTAKKKNVFIICIWEKKNMFGYDWKYRKLIYVINHFLFILMTQRLQWQDFQWIREIICFNYYNKLYDEKLLDLTCQYLVYFCPWKKIKLHIVSHFLLHVKPPPNTLILIFILGDLFLFLI